MRVQEYNGHVDELSKPGTSGEQTASQCKTEMDGVPVQKSCHHALVYEIQEVPICSWLFWEDSHLIENKTQRSVSKGNQEEAHVERWRWGDSVAQKSAWAALSLLFTVTNNSVFYSPGPSPTGLPGGHAGKVYGQCSKENRNSKRQKLLSINAIQQLNSSELGNDALYECFDYLLLSLPTVTPFVPIMTTWIIDLTSALPKATPAHSTWLSARVCLRATS